MNKSYNVIIISGTINVITDVNRQHIKFGLINNIKKHKKIFISLDIDRSLYNNYKDYFFVGNEIYVKGYLNSYIDKNNKIQSFITVTKMARNEIDITSENKLHIRYDNDGVMIWNGKRCESEIANDEEVKKMKEMLGGVYNERN